LFFVDDDGENFKTTVLHRPYFYVLTKKQDDMLGQLLLKKFSGLLAHVEQVPMKDLQQANHLSPNHSHRMVWKLIFRSVTQLMDVRNQLRDLLKSQDSNSMDGNGGNSNNVHTDIDKILTMHDSRRVSDSWTNMQELREYDVPYVARVCMDNNIRAGSWYTVTLEQTDDASPPHPVLSDADIETKGNPRVLAFDIECSKAPLKFPNADVDEIYMISYMCSDGRGTPQGYLITSRTIVSEDVADFDYTPNSKYPGPFKIFNEKDEAALIRRFVIEFQKYTPQIVVTFNGDFFDWPFLQKRAELIQVDLWTELGMCMVGGNSGSDQQGEFRGKNCVHMDAFSWVQRDSYLPQGSQGLKAVTKYKLGYDPVEVDPEDMLPMAQERPVHMATYSVSDAVATYYLYEKYVHLFIFSLCTLIPFGPEDVLRKGSGTLCEILLMVQANDLDIICPNKQIDPLAKFHKGHLLESETYIGGKVECLETGVYRSDVEYEFDLVPSAFQQLIDNIDRDLCFAIEVEAGMDRSEITNYEEVRSEIIEELELLRDRPKRVEKPYIYHLDVGAMYPNIILTNRLQPSAIVDDATCAACDFNQAKNQCKRRMDWVWRGDYTPAGKIEYTRAKDQLSRETMEDGRHFKELTSGEQEKVVATRLKEYSRKVYRKTKITEEVTRKDIVCMRENDFYVETVRRFRDRRYDYKKMTKSWKKRIGSATDPTSRKEAEDKALVYDSLQVAHKCILNSFYGYVMRKGARWRSMEMAGIVTKTGADLITQARVLVEQIGRPLELDTDGIWCILPKSFPDIYTFKGQDGSKLKLEYPCVMLNADVHDNFTNHQYQTLKDPKRGVYETRSDNSIFFEVDGPYRCMVIPASTEEGKLLKKRYAVFNFDGSLAELKGFELKRRGELELIKTFQSQIFERFLDGNSLIECYDSVAEVANHWIDVIDTRGESLDDDELVDLISENRNMSRQLDDYGDQKGTSQTTARRLSEFLGAEIIKDKGLNCKFIIAEQPYGAPVTERAIPTAIWMAQPAVMRHFLRKWLKSPGIDGDGFNIRNILDWDYYMARLGKNIQKIITIPAALQKVENPVPRVAHPAWLLSKVQQLNDKYQQKSILSMFGPKKLTNSTSTVSNGSKLPVPMDIEDIGGGKNPTKVGRPVVHSAKRLGQRAQISDIENVEGADREERIELESDKNNFDSWLDQKKKLWRKSRQERKKIRPYGDRERQSSQVGTRSKNPMSTLEDFVKEASLNLSQKEWQIIELREMTSHDTGKKKKPSSGEFIAWVMVGESLRKIQLSVPRTIYISTNQEIYCNLTEKLDFRKVDKHLPHSKKARFLYELTMPEFVYSRTNWTSSFCPVDKKSDGQNKLIEEVYESGAPLMTKILSELGSVSKLSLVDGSKKNQKSYNLKDLKMVNKPTEGIYLNNRVPYKRCFLYVRMNPKSKTGLVALFIIKGGSGSQKIENNDLTAPGKSGVDSFDISMTCQLWFVRPGSSTGQKNVSRKQSSELFSQLLSTIHEEADLESEYACVLKTSKCVVTDLNFVDKESAAYSATNESISKHLKSNNGPTFMLVNSSRPSIYLRRFIPTLNSLPAISLPFPPGTEHNPVSSTLPALNWEQPIVQLCLEAYLYMSIVSFPRRVGYARYGNIPVGNFGHEENFTLYDLSLTRMLHKNRAISWASPVRGQPDLGASLFPSSDGKVRSSIQLAGSTGVNSEDIWSDDNELLSPVVRRPGSYRSLCVDIDLHDLAIAALTDTANASTHASMTSDVGSPTSVMQQNSGGAFKSSEPLGDEMSTATSLPIIRALVGVWLHDAFTSNSSVADSLLHNVYRLISCPEALMHDSALHRVLHALMRGTFIRLLGELQRLGCTIIYANFHKITVSTNKLCLADAEEYINFVISTIRSQVSENGEDFSGLARVALRPRQYHTQLLFLDEYNFGTLQLERHHKDDVGGHSFIEEDTSENTVVVPSVVTAWSLINYMGSDIAEEYFRIIIGRFSKDVLKKERDLITRSEDDGLSSIFDVELNDKVLDYKRKMISKQFASTLTRAVGEIAKEEEDNRNNENNSLQKNLLTLTNRPVNSVLEFIKSVIVVLELDQEVDKEVHALKRSLLAQIGVAEYSHFARWENPCPNLMLPDCFCKECQESRDVNVCYIPPTEEDEAKQIHWFCEDCGTEYDVAAIERRLIDQAHKKMLRYQLQDLRCTKTNRVATRSLARVSQCSAEWQPDITPEQGRSEIETLFRLAKYHQLDELEWITQGMLQSFR
jgi:DNA polymerase epsilon subunit 1